MASASFCQLIRQTPSRNEHLPAHIERCEVIAPIVDADRHCTEHGERTIIGYDVTETLEFERPKLPMMVRSPCSVQCHHRL